MRGNSLKLTENPSTGLINFQSSIRRLNAISKLFLVGLLISVCFGTAACSTLGGLLAVKSIPTEFHIDTNSAFEASIDNRTLASFDKINDTIDALIASGIEIGPDTLSAISELNATLENGVLFGLTDASLATIDRLGELIGAGLKLNITLEPVQIVADVGPETRNWLTETITKYAPNLAEQIIGDVTWGATSFSDEVKNDLIQILQEAENSFGEVVKIIGIEGRCNVDFLSGRIDSTLDRTIDRFTAEVTISRIMGLIGEDTIDPTTKTTKAVICRIIPAPLDLIENSGTLIPKQDQQYLDIVGYDFFKDNLPVIEIRTETGEVVASAKPSLISNYQFQVNLQTVDFNNVGRGAEITIEWPDGGSNSVIILQPAPTLVPTLAPTLTPTSTIEPCPVAMINSPDGVLSIRTGPGMIYDKLGELPNGPSPCVTGKALDIQSLKGPNGEIVTWWEIDLGGQLVWISGLYSSVENPENIPDKLPPATPVPPPPSTPLPPPPIAAFQCAPTEGRAPLTIDCVDLSTNNPTTWLWEFGDGSISSNPNTEHTYDSTGQFTVKLTVINDQGSSTKELAINVQPPVSSLPIEEPVSLPIRWIEFEGGEVKVGSEPAANLEIRSDPIASDYVITGVGGRLNNGNFTTLWLEVGEIQGNGIINKLKDPLKFGTDRGTCCEVFQSVGNQQVVVGLGMREDDSNLTTLVIYARELDPETGLLGERVHVYRAGPEQDAILEVDYYEQFESLIVVGIGVRANDKSITTLVLQYGLIGRQ